MRGYANNYDFIRVAGWFSLWPERPATEPDFDPRSRHHRAPLRCYRVDPSVDTPIRYPSTELGVVWLALRVHDAWRAVAGPRECDVDLRVVGWLRAVLLLATGIAITRAFGRRVPAAGVASAAILAVVLADPAVTLLLNTLYSDFSTILFTYAAGAQIVYALAFRSFRPASGLLLGATLLALAGTKTQYAGLPIVLAALLAAGALAAPLGAAPRRARGAFLAIVIASSLGGVAAQQTALRDDGYMWSMRMGAATDTFFGAVLPLHRDPDRALELLGLPARCRAYVGRTWYDEGMQPPPCPEVGDVPRWKIARLVLDDPALVGRLAARALPLLQPMIVRWYGQVEGGDLAQADDAWWATSISRLVEALPTSVYAILVGLTLLAGLLGVVTIILPRHAGGPEELLLPALAAVAGAVEAYVFTTSLVGAGFIDLGRHSITGQLAFAILLPVVAVLPLRLRSRSARIAA